jgi:hypothetical protein
MVLQTENHNNSIILEEPYVIKPHFSLPTVDLPYLPTIYFPNLQTFKVKYVLDVNNSYDFAV